MDLAIGTNSTFTGVNVQSFSVLMTSAMNSARQTPYNPHGGGGNLTMMAVPIQK